MKLTILLIGFPPRPLASLLKLFAKVKINFHLSVEIFQFQSSSSFYFSFTMRWDLQQYADNV